MKQGTTIAVVSAIIATIALIPAVNGRVWAIEETGASIPRREPVTDQRERLRGLKGVGVVVEALPAGAERYGLGKAALRSSARAWASLRICFSSSDSSPSAEP